MTSGPRSLPVLSLAVALAAVAVVANPEASLVAARQGLQLWWAAVLPSLLPFFILNDLLQALGVVKALGFLCEPLMRPLFNLPGAAGFALAVGFTSGFPAGARAAASLTSAGLCTPEEGSRLAAFANAAGPLFITGVTAVSLFRTPAAGPLLALAHYGAALMVGILLARLPSVRQPAPGDDRRSGGHSRSRRPPALRSAWQALREAAETTPPLGQLLGAVVRSAGQAVLVIGGFIVF
ncbi:MAG TPA: sporulation integral membrane protein YlbJ, partial [Firmicutes bacterium]|nr:sporulation integral membrane protein YlbJ [Bacillota bacterium]